MKLFLKSERRNSFGSTFLFAFMFNSLNSSLTSHNEFYFTFHEKENPRKTFLTCIRFRGGWNEIIYFLYLFVTKVMRQFKIVPTKIFKQKIEPKGEQQKSIALHIKTYFFCAFLFCPIAPCLQGSKFYSVALRPFSRSNRRRWKAKSS